METEMDTIDFHFEPEAKTQQDVLVALQNNNE